jgi:hypothetical protein
MKILYMPLYRMAVSYLVSTGRRWSILEHLLLVEITSSRRTVPELSALSNMPDRLLIEAIINLMRAGWIEVRSTDAGVSFDATNVGRLRAKDQDLPVRLLRDVRWISLCVDRLTGTWHRADDLELVYERDLPDEANILEPLIHTYDPNEGALRDLFYLNADEALEPSLPQFRTPSKPYARITVAFERIVAGLPPLAPMKLKHALLRAAEAFAEVEDQTLGEAGPATGEALCDDIGVDDLVVGGTEHRELLRDCLRRAENTIIIHSCFVSSETVRALLPDFEEAAKRKVRVELLWGLHTDPEQPTKRKPVSETEKVLNALPAPLRRRVQLSPISSGSHAKVILFDGPEQEGWTTVIGSCNYLSTEFDWVECSVRCRSQRLASQILGRLIALQLPASGSWSPVARRLNNAWSELRLKAGRAKQNGSHRVTLLADDDHYACVTLARDFVKKDIVVACDLYGLSAETSVLVPMESAAGTGKSVKLFYCRPSKLLREEGRGPDSATIQARGMAIAQMPDFHAKFLTWDRNAVAITSFNWMSTVVDGSRARGAEFGLLIEGDGIAAILAEKLKRVSKGTIDIRI